MVLNGLISMMIKNKPKTVITFDSRFELLNNDLMPEDDYEGKRVRKKFKKVDDRHYWLLKMLLNRLKLRHFDALDISLPDPHYKVVYLGNILTSWSKDENCLLKPLTILWKSHDQHHKAEIQMNLLIGCDGLKATTKEHGLTEYWANRITYCCNPSHYPKLFCWVYRHECKRLRHELRCHAVICSSTSVAKAIEQQLRASLARALADFKKDKILKQNARLSLNSDRVVVGSLPKRKMLLCKGGLNYRPPLERSKSAPRLTIIEELHSEDDNDDCSINNMLNRNRLLKRLQTSPEILINSCSQNVECSHEVVDDDIDVNVIDNNCDLDNLSDESGYVEFSDSNSVKSNPDIKDSNDGDKS